MNEKPFFQSKTVWVQVVTILSAFIPAVRDWFANNPVEFLTALGALNVLVRFITSGKVKLFSSDGGTSGTVSVLVCMVSMAAGLLMVLSSCSVLEGVDVNGKIYYRADNGAKGGIDFVRGEKPALWWRFGVPIVSKEGGLVPAKDEPVVIEATK